MITHESRGRDLARLIVWYPLRWVIHMLPKAEWSLSFFRAMGRIHAALSGEKRDLVEAALKRSSLGLSPQQERDESLHFLENHYASSLLIMVAPKLSLPAMDRLHSFEGMDHLKAALAGEKGTVIIHPHMGPAQLPLLHLGLMGHRVVQVGALVEPEGLSSVGERITRIRKSNERTIPAKIVNPTRFLRVLFETLEEGGIVFIPGDGSGFGRSYGRQLSIPFLGNEVSFPTGAVALAHKTKAPLLPLFTTRRGRGYSSTLLPPIDPGTGKDERYRTGVEAFAHLFEDALRRSPGLWLLWDEFAPKVVDG